MSRGRPAGALVLLCWAAGAPAQQGAVEVCSGISDPAQRLACYDRLSTPATSPPAQPQEPPPAAPAPADPAAERFGLPEQRDAVDAIKARLVGPLVTWERGTRFRLDNGQVWQAVERQGGHYTNIPENPEVVIYRGFWGPYWLEIPGASVKIKVKRVS